MEVLEIIQSAYSSIQDDGRFGYRSFAIPQSGCLDPQMQAIANYLAGNQLNCPTIEIIGGKLIAEGLEKIRLGIAGVNVTVKVNGQQIDTLSTIELSKKDHIEIIATLAYLAICGELASKKHFDSYSSYPLAELGRTPFRRGDRIEGKISKIELRSLRSDFIPTLNQQELIRVIKGPEWGMVDVDDETFEKMEWKITTQSNRIGIRLDGNAIKISEREMVSVPTFPGTIQLPPDGKPIVLMNDAQTTGGYPRIGQVIKADLPRLARLMMGGSIRFKFVTIPEARYIFERQQSLIKHEIK